MAFSVGQGIPQPTGLADSLSKQFQALVNGLNNTQNSQANSLPWSDVQSAFFPFIAIKPERWDQLFPYRLLVIDTRKGNQVVGGTNSAKVTVTNSDTNSIVSFEPLGKKWVFTLPISPQQLKITDQFAINTTATLKGVLEEHGGLKFKTIFAQGTMGVWPYRQSVTAPPSSPSVLESIFGGTLEAVGELVGQVNRVINAATSGHPAGKPAARRPETSAQGSTSTGYYQALALQQFLEQYAEAKKNPANAGWRLVFDIPKQNASYVVSPEMFDWSQSVTKPMEIMYTMQLKAWRRIDLQEKVAAVVPDLQQITPGILQRIMSTITEARRVTSSAVDLIGAVRSDVEKPLDVLRQTSLFVKDLAGVATSVADLPFQIQQDYKSSIKESMRILKDSISSASSDPKVRAGLNSIIASSVITEGLSIAAVAGGQLGNLAVVNQSLDPSNNIFDNPERNFDLMDQVPVASLFLNDAQQNAVDTVVANARETTVDDLRQYRAVIADLTLQLSNNFGAGDAYYSQIYGRPAPKERIQPMTLDEYDILKALYETLTCYDILTATTDIDDLNKKSNMEYVAGLADAADIPFDVPTSKVLVPVPYGKNVEQIALRYLGDAQRWLEIVTLNNLRDPYIDETGFKRMLLSNATGRQITINSSENLYIGQRVIIGSTTQVQSPRRILGLDRLSDTSFLVTLDGEADLDNFVIADLAYMQAYLPGTVNSQQKIFIPSTLGVPPSDNIVIPASVQGVDLVGLSKVDWLLTESGDLATNNYGDFRYAAGITNLMQAIRIKLLTPKGRLLPHPEFGLGLRPGTINSEIDVQDIFNSINKMIEDDPRFQGLDNLQISINGPTLSISMGVMITGQNGVFPLSFQLAS